MHKSISLCLIAAVTLCANLHSDNLSDTGYRDLIQKISFDNQSTVALLGKSGKPLAERLQKEFPDATVTLYLSQAPKETKNEPFDVRTYTPSDLHALTTHDPAHTTIIVTNAGEMGSEASLTKTFATLPDGVKIISQAELTENPAVRLLSMITLTTKAGDSILMYNYIIKKPTIGEILDTFYHKLAIPSSGFRIPAEEAQQINVFGGKHAKYEAATYGEITFAAMEKLFTTSVPLKEHDVFYDLGSGVGKLVLWVGLATPARTSVGIELSETRHTHAEEAYKEFVKTIVPQHPAFKAKLQKTDITFIQGNILEENLDKATVIYMCATCFSDELMKAICDKLSKLKDGVIIITLKALPDTYKEFRLLHNPTLPMSWSENSGGSPVFVYEIHRPQLHDLLQTAYKDVNGFSIPTEEDTQIRDCGSSSVYGEITEPSAQKLLTTILKIDEHDVVYDLGCGTGKFIAQAYLESPAQKVVGVELSDTRYTTAMAARTTILEDLKKEPYATLWKNAYGERDRSWNIVKGDLTTIDLEAATKIFICSTCFPDELMKTLTAKCAKLRKGTLIATLKRLSGVPCLSLTQTYTLPMTWSSSGVDVFLYKVVEPQKQSAQKTKN